MTIYRLDAYFTLIQISSTLRTKSIAIQAHPSGVRLCLIMKV